MNPKIFFQGVRGNRLLSSLIASDLKNCGWFTPSTNRKAKYVLSGAVQGNRLTINVKYGNGTNIFTSALSVNSRNLNKTAHEAVDLILKKLFGIDGICSSKIAFTLEYKPNKKEIFICDFDGKNIKRITKNNNLSVEPAWSPDCRNIVYTWYGKASTDIVEYNLASRRSRRIAQFPGLNSAAEISPNNKLMALILSKDRYVELYIASISGRGLKRLTKSRSVESSPCWSPTGRQICFVSDRGGRPQLYLINAKGGPFKRIPTKGLEAVSPDWSKSNKIIYSARMGRSYTIAVTDMGSSENRLAIRAAAGDWESPSWAPDNRHAVCSRTYNGKSSLFIIDTWTGKVRQLLSLKYNLNLPNWSNIEK